MFKHHDSDTYLESKATTFHELPSDSRQRNVSRLGAELCASQDTEERQHAFQIRLASTEHGRSHASSLVHRMYATRGYTVSDTTEECPHRVTVTIAEAEQVIGTITLGIDSSAGILADEIFPDEVADFRQRGRKVCELTKLAFDPATRSKTALASLFHIIFIYLRRVQKCSDIFIEVNPRHRRFYERMLGFKKVGHKKTNLRVNAPAYLLCVDTAYVEQQIEKHGGTAGLEHAEKSLYPYFFCPVSEQKNKLLIGKYLDILRNDPANAAAVNELAWIYQATRSASVVPEFDQSH